jgi:catechol 2,3-dioxygenase-like lactoylglutathione lyase family enzyme
MEIEGVDRVVIGVKDMDKGLRFFRDVFGIEFVETRRRSPGGWRRGERPSCLLWPSRGKC